MMKEEVTAENRPAYHPMNKNAFTDTTCGTHEDQGIVQVLVIFLEEFPIVLLRHPAIVPVEFSLMVFLDRRCASVE